MRRAWRVCLFLLLVAGAARAADAPGAQGLFLLESSDSGYGFSKDYINQAYNQITNQIFFEKSLTLDMAIVFDFEKSLGLFRSGKVVMAQIPVSTYFMLLDEGLPYDPIATWQYMSKGGGYAEHCLFTKREDLLKQPPKALRGKKLGIRYAVDYMALRSALVKSGIGTPPAKFFKSVRVLGDDTSIYKAMTLGLVDVTVSTPQRVKLNASNKKEYESLLQGRCFEELPMLVMVASRKVPPSLKTFLTQFTIHTEKNPKLDLAHTYHEVSDGKFFDDFTGMDELYAFWKQGRKKGWLAEYMDLWETR